MTAEGQELAVRPSRAPIDAILGTGDIRVMIEQARENVGFAVEIARDRGFVTDFEVKDKAGNVTGTRAFFHLATWQLLGQSWGLTAYTEGIPDEVKPGVWQAAAIAANVQSGQIVGRAVAMCSRNEPGKKYKNDHDLSATAQSRAQRNALRSCLGSILIAAGFDFADPDAPATREQIGMLHQLERDLEMSHDQGHERAAVLSYKDLTREQASEVIDEWTREQEKRGVGHHDEPKATEEAGKAPPSPGSPIITSRHGYAGGDPVTQAQLNKMSVLAAKLEWDDAERHRQAEIESWKSLSKREASHLISEWQQAAEGSAGGRAGADPEPSAEPPDPEREAVYDHARALFDTDGAMLRAAHDINPEITKLEQLDIDGLNELIVARTP